VDARTRKAGPRSGALLVVAAVLAVAGGGCGGDGSGSAANHRRHQVAAAAVAATPVTSTPVTSTPGLGRHDGSLGDADSKQACSLLTASEIDAQFGGPVGAATPIYPYCQWLVGDDAFVALTIYRQPIDEARQFHPVRFNTSGLGDDGGYIATTRAVFFGRNGVTYSILWQKVGDFTTVETDRLSALAQLVLGRV
jgi:hypothetical protein